MHTEENISMTSSAMTQCDICGNTLAHAPDSSGYLVCEGCGTMSYVGGEVQTCRDDGAYAYRTSICSYAFENDTMKCIRRFNRFSEVAGNRERMLIRGYEDIDNVARKIQLSESVVSNAKRTFSDSTAKPEFRKKRRSALVAACVYLAARNNGISCCTVSQICRILDFPARLVFDAIHMMDSDVMTVNPRSLIPAICSRLRLDKNVQSIALDMVDRLDVTGSDCCFRPSSIAAGIVLLCVDSKKVNHKCIVNASGVSMTTLTKCSRYLMDLMAERDMYFDRVLASNKTPLKEDPVLPVRE